MFTAPAPDTQRTRRLFNHLAAFTVAFAALLASAAAWADPPGRVGRIAESEGAFWTFDAEQGEWITAKRNRPLTSGDRLSAERDARAELQIGSATVRLDGDSEVEITELDDERVSLHLRHGSLALRLRSNESAREFSITTNEGRFDPQRAGHYRVDQAENGSFGGTITGSMRFEARDSTLELNAGQRAEFWNERGVTHYAWSQLPGDRFADWVARQDRRDDREAQSRPYVSPEMTGADDLDRYGDWDRHPEYGALWYPRQVESGWAPYRQGHWAHVRPWGWTWVDDAPWGFAPFHYGRWVSWQGRWAWAPGQYVARPIYAPALVAWIGGGNVSVGINIGGPSVGWVPLSPREVYYPYYSVTNIYINNLNSPYRRWHPPVRPGQPVRTGPIMYSNQGVPGGVTVVPQNVLRERRPISSAVVATVDAGTVARWRTQPLPGAAPQQPDGRGNNGRTERRPQDMAPPPPVSRAVVAVPGGAIAVPAAPGAARNRPWTRGEGGSRVVARPAPPQARDEVAAPPTGRPPLADPRGRPPQANDRVERSERVERGQAVGRPIDAAPPAAAVVPQRDLQDRRNRGNDSDRDSGRDLNRDDNRRGIPAPPRQTERPVPPGQARQQAEPPRGVPAARAVPPQSAPQVAPVAGARPAPAPQAPVMAAPQVQPLPAPVVRDEPSRGRGQQRNGEERDDRQPPGQERRRDLRQQ